MTALLIEGVHATYATAGTRRQILHDVTVSVATSEVVALVGPNGAGKSTLLRVASGILRPTAGRVLLEGRDLASLAPREVARRVAVVQQDPTFPPGATGRELVALGRTPHIGALRGPDRRDWAAVGRALRATAAEPLADRFLDELSGGERQRLVLGRALAQEPAVLLLDEPTANLDLRHQVGMLELIRGLASQGGLAVLAAMHDLQLAALYADRVAVLREGRVVADGAPEEVLTASLVAHVFEQPVALVPHPTHGVPLAVPDSGGRTRRAASAEAPIAAPPTARLR